MNPSRAVLSVLCPECGAQPGDECWDDHEHPHRFTAAFGDDELTWWPEFDYDRLVELAAMPYRDYLLTDEWAERREAIRDRAGRRCEHCGGTHRLQVHHTTYERRGYEWPADLKLLCGHCHTACHADQRMRGASVSYGAYVQACIDERRRAVLGNASWEYGAVKYANDNFSDYPEHRVVEVLRDMRWPDRPVTVSEVQRQLKERVTVEERRAWLRDLDVEAPTT